MVRKDPQTTPHGEVFGLQRVARHRLKDPVFLVRARHADVKPSDGTTREVADKAVPEVFVLTGRTAVARHRHPARVDDHLTFFLLVPDHGRQDRARDAVERANAEVRHEEVEHRIDAAADFRDARFVFGGKDGRRGADGDDRNFDPFGTEPVGCQYDPVPLAPGGFAGVRGAFLVVTRARVGEKARKAGAPRQALHNLKELIRLGRDPRAVSVDVDFNKHGNFDRARGRVGRDVAGGVDVVEKNLEVAPGSADALHAPQLLRSDPDGVNQVRDAVRGEVFGFQEGRNGRGSFGRHHLAARDLDRLVGLEVRTKRHAERSGAVFGGGEVRFELGVGNEEGRGFDGRVVKAAADAGIGGGVGKHGEVKS